MFFLWYKRYNKHLDVTQQRIMGYKMEMSDSAHEGRGGLISYCGMNSDDIQRSLCELLLRQTF